MVVKLINQYKGRLALATCFSALSSVVSVFLLATINNKINVTSVNEIHTVVPMFLGLVISLFAISFFSQLFLAKLGTSFVYRLRSTLLQQAINVSYENLERIGGHRVLATITTDVNNIALALAILPVFAVNLATIIFCLTYLGIQSGWLFLFLMGGLITGIGGSYLIMVRGRDYFIQLREKEDNLFCAFKTLVDGSKELNINQHRRDFFYSKQAMPGIEDIRETELKAKGFWILGESMTRALLFLTLGGVLFIAHSFMTVESQILTSFILFTTYIIGPISFVQTATQSLVRGKIAYQKVASLELNQDYIRVSKEHLQHQQDWGQLVFDNIKYTYQEKRDYPFTMGPVSLTVNRGENIFICGGNGSGKSTFAKILVGLYHPQEGSLSFAGQVINDKNIQWYRNHFSTIFSDFFLFEHLLDSKGELLQKESVVEHLKKLKMHDKVDIIDGKVSSTKLSQGQRKRLAMLLAYAEDAPIYLFDEWAADQDPTFREYFYRELLPELQSKGKTLIVITHDDKYFELADRLIKFDNGKLTEVKPVNQSMSVENTTPV